MRRFFGNIQVAMTPIMKPENTTPATKPKAISSNLSLIFLIKKTEISLNEVAIPARRLTMNQTRTISMIMEY